MPRACCVHAACICVRMMSSQWLTVALTLHCCGSCEAERAEQRNRLQTQLLEANITNTRRIRKLLR